MSQKILVFISFLGIIIISGALYALVTKKYTPYTEPVQVRNIEYKNTTYGFSVALPSSWEGYSVVQDTWESNYLGMSQDIDTYSKTGPMLSLRSPMWQEATPRQDIPIMIFTVAQWDLLMNEKIHIGAAPIPPSELGRNTAYVFALPARYNYAFLPGFEEVDTIIKTQPLKGF